MKEILLNSKPPCVGIETYEELLTLLYANDERAYSCLIKICKSLIVSFKHEFFYLSEWEVEELTWDALTELIQKLKHYSVRAGNLKALLRSIAEMDIRDLIKKKIIKYNDDGRLVRSAKAKGEPQGEETTEAKKNDKKGGSKKPKKDKDYTEYLLKTKYLEVDEGFERYYLNSDIYDVESLLVYNEFEGQLSENEKEVLEAIYPKTNGMPLDDSEIAFKLNKSEKTIKNLKSIIKNKLITFFDLKVNPKGEKAIYNEIDDESDKDIY